MDMSDDTIDERPERILARATVHLPDVALGTEGWVDPDSLYIAGCLQKGYLVPVEAELAPEAEPEPDAEVPAGAEPEAEADPVAVVVPAAEAEPEPPPVEQIQLDGEAAADDPE